MHCPTCDAINAETNRFCENCGVGLLLACPACGYSYSLGGNFCGGCGISLNRNVLATPPSAPGKVPGEWGELKQATVLFADIVNSTRHIAEMDPEEAMERLRPAIHRMCDAVERFGGTVVRTLGDGVMAIFGVPFALEGHALLACEAALKMQEAFKQDSQGLMIRIGLHSGQVASDPQEGNGGKGGGAHGLTIHMASRVVALAEPGGVCLTGACRALVDTSCGVRSLGDHILKGFPGLTTIYALTGLRTSPSDAQSQRDWVTPFRGRSRQLEQMKHAQRFTGKGDTRVIGICAEPGGGKSRLCYEFTQWCRGQSIPVCEVRAQLYGHATPLQPVLSLLRRFYFNIADTDSADVARTRVAQRLGRAGVSGDDVALVYEFLGMKEPEAKDSSLSPRAKHSQLLAVVRKLVRDQARNPAVILIEDLHWLDEASEEFVSVLVDAVADTHTLVVLNYRPGYHPPWAKAPHFLSIELSELDAADMDTLVAELLGNHPELAEVRRLVVTRSAGNPFFAEELAHTLLENKLLFGEDGLPKVVLSEVEGSLPETVQAVIGARVDNLGEPEKTLLQMCAIIGKEIPQSVLEDVASPLSQVIEAGLAGLCRAGLIQQQTASGKRHFAFRHPLIQEVAYSTQLRVRRSVLHSAVAGAMETYYRDQLDEYAGLISYHYEEAGHFLPAARHASNAARWVGLTNTALAIKHWHKVRALLGNQPRAPDNDSLRATACSQITLLGWREGLTLEQVQPFLDEAMSLADELDYRLIQRMLIMEGRMLLASGGSADEYVERAQRALQLPGVESNQGRLASLNSALSHAFGWAGLLQKGLIANSVALEGAAHIDHFDREYLGFSYEHWIRGMRGRLLIRLGRFEEAQDCFKQMLVAGDAAYDPVIAQMAHFGHVELAWCREDMPLAEEHCKMVTEIAEKFGSKYLRVFALYCLALTRGIIGDFQQSKTYFSEALVLIQTARVALEFETELLANLAESCRCMGEYDQALAIAHEAVELSRTRNTRIPECRALITLGAVLVDIQEPRGFAEAEAAFAAAEILVRQTGVKIFEKPLSAAKLKLLGVTG